MTDTTTTTTTSKSSTDVPPSSAKYKLTETKFKGHKDSVVFVTLHPNKPILASSSDDCTVRLWDVDRRSSIKSINSFGDEPVNSIAFDQENYIYCAHSNKISCFDLRNPSIILKESINQFNFNTEEINQINFDPKYQYIASCDNSGQIKIIDINKKKLHETLAKKHTNICSNALFRPNSKNELISGSYDYSVIQWDYLKAKLKRRESFQQATQPTTKSKQQQSQPAQQKQILNPPFVNSLDVSRDGKLMAIGLGSGDVLVSDISSFSTHVHLGSAHNSPLSIVHFPRFSLQGESSSSSSSDPQQTSNSNNNYLISAGIDSNIILWDIEKNDATQKPTKKDSNNNIVDINANPNEDRIKIWTHHPSKVNWITTSYNSPQIYVADLSNDITLLTIV